MPLFFLFLALANFTPGTFQIFGHTWSVPNAEDWSVDSKDSAPTLHLRTGRVPLPGPRRPFQFAVASTSAFRKVTIEADVKPLQKSLMLVFAYQDEAHFNYAHFSTDEAAKIAVHNGVFHVYGGERVRISAQEGPAAFKASQQWYHIKLVWDGATGEVQGYVDGTAVAALHAVDLSLNSGKVGLGSFDETADFKNVTVR